MKKPFSNAYDAIKKLFRKKVVITVHNSMVENYFKETNKIDDEIISVVVAPCTAKKYEKQFNDTDYVITTRELAIPNSWLKDTFFLGFGCIYSYWGSVIYWE